MCDAMCVVAVARRGVEAVREAGRVMAVREAVCVVAVVRRCVWWQSVLGDAWWRW